MALDKLKVDYDFNDFDFRFSIGYSDCDLAKTLGLGIEYMLRQNADVVIEPSCPEEYRIGACALQVVSQFTWDIISIIYTTNEVRFCDDMIDSLMDSFNGASASSTPRVALKQIIDEDDNDSYTRTLQQIKARSRVVILCMDLATDRRGFLIRANRMGMTNSEYVFLMLNIRSTGFGRAGAGKEILANGFMPFWEDSVNGNIDGMDSVANSAAKYMILVSDLQIGKIVDDFLLCSST
ncbi:unnamed protein product [Strongylus vulgaris]|uniref:Receptor ligand binding region domain-containing protein n=1 Tax=Strongylus vulgaris TaxID=40348 RepID=A0A3P7IQ41_STRVU|nr:unnamed protein product [Strongylus vulgaris]